MSQITTTCPATVSVTKTFDQGDWKIIDAMAYNIETYYLWVILVLGFPANCFSILTIIKMSPPRSLTVYIALLAIVDNLAIVNKLLIFVLMDYGVEIGSFGCKFLGFCGNFLITLANWLLVALSVERFAAVWFPLKVGQNWTFRKSLLVVGGITVPLLLLFLHLFWTTDYIAMDYPGTSFCGIRERYIDFMIDVWYWMNVVMYAILPCTLLLTFNVLIVAGILKSGRLHQYLNRDDSVTNVNITTNRQRQVTIMLVTSAVALVILTTPRCVFLIMSPYWTAPENSHKGATWYLLDTIAFVLCDSTHAVNFYLYSCSARRFRRQFRDLVLCRKRKRPRSLQYYTVSCHQTIRFNTALRIADRPCVRYRSQDY